MRRFTRVLFGQIALLAVAAGAVWGATRALPLVEWVSALQAKVVALPYGGGALYPFLYAACNLLLLPGGVFAMGAGLFFGLWWGTALVLLGNVLAAAAAFLIGRRFGRGRLERRLAHHPRWQALDTAIHAEGWKIIFLSQVHPLAPSSLLNYLYGLTGIRFSTCLFWVAVAQLPGTFLYVYLGTLAQLGLRMAHGETHPQKVEYWVWLGGLGVTIIVTLALGQVAFRLLARVQDAGKPPLSPQPFDTAP